MFLLGLTPGLPAQLQDKGLGKESPPRIEPPVFPALWPRGSQTPAKLSMGKCPGNVGTFYSPFGNQGVDDGSPARSPRPGAGGPGERARSAGTPRHQMSPTCHRIYSMGEEGPREGRVLPRR